MNIVVAGKTGDEDFSATEGERILYAGLRQGLALPHECATGTCGSCKAVLKSGSLYKLWDAAPGAKSCKAARNEFLMCQSAAASDCEISFRGKLEPKNISRSGPDYFAGEIFESENLTRDVQRLKVRFDRPLSFRPGQFVVANVNGLEGGRAYSMVNENHDSAELEFIVKRLPGGGFSEWLFNESRDGASISVFGPLGNATLDPDEGKDLLCITGGSGIAGILSLLTQAVNNSYFAKNSGHLFFGVRTYQDLFFHNRLLQLNELSEQKLKITFTFSDGAIPPENDDKAEGIQYLIGDVTPVAMQQLGNDFENAIAFLAGPPGMVDDAIKRLVIEAGFPVDRIRYDKFG